jgi:hypothetical protein
MATNANQNQNSTPPPRISMVIQVPQQWQYAQQVDCTVARLNELGKDGWELTGPPVVANTTLGTSGKLLYVFKRPMQTPAR